MKILFTICGRAGSKGLKNKNLKQMNGKALVYYTLAAIYVYSHKHPEHQIKTALNTDSDALRQAAQSQKEVEMMYVSRSQDLAGDTVPKVDVVKDTYLLCAKTEEFDAVVDLDLTSPLRRVEDIENAIQVYHENRQLDVVFSVVHSRRSPYFNMVERKEDGLYRKICGSEYTARQQAPDTYELNASIYVYRPAFLKRNITKTLLDHDCGISIMKDYLVLDIDSEEDFRMMEMLYLHYADVDEGIKRIYETTKRLGEARYVPS